MEFVVEYAIKQDQVVFDRRLLGEAYAELARRRPPWLACRTFVRSDGLATLFQVAVDDMTRLADLDQMAAYWNTLGRRCSDRPRTSRRDWDSIPTSGLRSLGAWAPQRQPRAASVMATVR